jgi:hypothetical protein
MRPGDAGSRATLMGWNSSRTPSDFTRVASHTDFKSTQGYVEQGQKLAAGFGTQFPPLPGR